MGVNVLNHNTPQNPIDITLVADTPGGMSEAALLRALGCASGRVRRDIVVPYDGDTLARTAQLHGGITFATFSDYKHSEHALDLVVAESLSDVGSTVCLMGSRWMITP